MPDIFVSYTHLDEAWAEWIAWALEEAGHTSILQKWDFRPGSNFVLEMQSAAARADQTIAVLSADYLKSNFAAPEWAAAFAKDPSGLGRKLVPVRVDGVDPKGLFGAIVYVDLVGKDAAEAKSLLLAGLNPGRAKPATPPSFPGRAATPKPYPGAQSPTAPRATAGLRIHRQPSDLDKSRFLRDGFTVVATNFQAYLGALQRENPGVETDFEREENSGFRAEVYVDGKLRANCRIWLGGMMGDNGISYAEGATARMGNAINEKIPLSDGDELAFRALGMGFGKPPSGIDPHRMSADEASQFLWARFLERLT